MCYTNSVGLRRISAPEASAAIATPSGGVGIIGPLIDGMDDVIRTEIEGLRQRVEARCRLVVILTTNGGFIETVQRIVETLRHHYEHINFVIPNYAFSAGTVLAMSGDQIYMDYYSRL